MTPLEAMRSALDAIENDEDDWDLKVESLLKDAIAEMEKVVPVGEIIEMDDYTCIPIFKNGTPNPGTKLYTHPLIPEGWQLVPVEPTDEMLDAWNSCDL